MPDTASGLWSGILTLIVFACDAGGRRHLILEIVAPKGTGVCLRQPQGMECISAPRRSCGYWRLPSSAAEIDMIPAPASDEGQPQPTLMPRLRLGNGVGVKENSARGEWILFHPSAQFCRWFEWGAESEVAKQRSPTLESSAVSARTRAQFSSRADKRFSFILWRNSADGLNGGALAGSRIDRLPHRIHRHFAAII